MEDSNESLQTMDFNKHFQDNDSYMDIEVKEGNNPTIDGTEVSTFTTKTLRLADEKRLNTISKNQDSISPELLAYLQQSEILSQGGRGENSSPVKKGSSLHK